MKAFILMKGKHYFNSLVYLILISIYCSCASYKTRPFGKGKNWENEKPSPNLILKHRMYLVGDAGNSTEPHVVPVLKYLKDTLSKESEHSSILFLGDNIYPGGMPPKGNTNRVAAEYSICTQLDAIATFKGIPMVIPGNHDWKFDKDSLREQREYVQNYLGSARNTTNVNYFIPLKGDIGPFAVELNDNTVVIIVDSDQLIKKWKNESNGSTVGELFNVRLDNVLNSYKSKNIVFAMHHPIYSYGPHGGHLSFWQHIFPGTEFRPWLIIPLPLIGWIGRRIIGIPQDVHNNKYDRLRYAMLAAVENKGRFTFVSGHEHTLQYIEKNSQNFIISGSGSKTSPVGRGKGSLFSSSLIGFSTLSFFEGGETWVTYYQVTKDGKNAPVIFQKRIK